LSSNVAAIDIGPNHSLALLRNGTAWRWSGISLSTLNISNTVAISAGGNHNLALKEDGTVIIPGQLPPFLPGTAAAIAAGDSHHLVLLKDGSIVAWGVNI